MVHAFVAPVVFAACSALVVFTSALWKPPSAEDSYGLRYYVLACPVLVLVQIGLGAAYRHKLTGVLPHIAGAMLIAGFLLIVCALVMQSSELRSARRAAAALLSVVLVQVSLGIAAFTMRLLNFETHPAFIVVSVAHVFTGSLTLAAGVVLAIQFPRDELTTAAPGRADS